MTQVKQYFIGFILAFCSYSSIGQVNIKAIKLTNIDANVLYIGVDNVLKVEGFDNLPVKLVSQKGAVKQINGNEFIVHVSSLGADTLTVFKNGKEIFYKPFEISRIVDPVVRIGKSISDVATVAEILSDPGLNVFLPNCYYINPFKVSGFSGSFITRNGRSIQTFNSATNKFLKEQLNIIKTLKSGDKILFDQILVIGLDSNRRMLPNLSVSIQ